MSYPFRSMLFSTRFFTVYGAKQINWFLAPYQLLFGNSMVKKDKKSNKMQFKTITKCYTNAFRRISKAFL